jgi:DNA-binding transcriptional LysR family regulator
MNLQRYRHFLAVAETSNFARAAERLGMKQPPLSQSIRRLERDLGVLLLERTTQSVRLTKAGEAFLPDARSAVDASARAEARARAAGSAAAPLRVGVVSVALFDTLADLLTAARQARIPLRIVYASTNDQLARLADGRLDLGLVTPPFEAPSRLQVTRIANEPIVAALPSGSTPREGSVSPEALHDRLILFPRADGPALYDAILGMFRAEGLTPTIIEETPASMLATLALVAAGVGASFVPAAIARNVTVEGVAFRPIASATGPPTWPISLAHMPIAARSREARLLARWRETAGRAAAGA